MITFYKIFFILFTSLLFSGCIMRGGHQPFVKMYNNHLGKKNLFDKYKFESYGQIIGGFRKSGYGLTHITKDKNGNLIYHWDHWEVLPNYNDKKAVGKCKVYEIVDPKTKIVKAWGFEPDSNPLSCQVWGG